MTEEDQLWKQYNDQWWKSWEVQDYEKVLERELDFRRYAQAVFPPGKKWYWKNIGKPYSGGMPSREANDKRISDLVTMIARSKKYILESKAKEAELYQNIKRLREEKQRRREEEKNE